MSFFENIRGMTWMFGLDFLSLVIVYLVNLNLIVMKKFFGLLAVLLCFGSMAFAAAQPSDADDSVSVYAACDANQPELMTSPLGEVFDFGTAIWLVAYEVPTSAVVFRANEGDVSDGYGNLIDQPPVATTETLDDPISR